jgi:hypothetical protein
VGIQYITFFPAVIITTLISGFRAGLICVALSAAVAGFFVLPPRWSFYIAHPGEYRLGIDDGTFIISWTERNGPPVSPPKRRGFGALVMETMAARSVDGTVDLDYASSGVTWRAWLAEQQTRCLPGRPGALVGQLTNATADRTVTFEHRSAIAVLLSDGHCEIV